MRNPAMRYALAELPQGQYEAVDLHRNVLPVFNTRSFRRDVVQRDIDILNREYERWQCERFYAAAHQ